MVERLNPDHLAAVNGDTDIRAFIESDFKIRSGTCPNGHGLMSQMVWGQECPSCGFSTNVLAEQGPVH